MDFKAIPGMLHNLASYPTTLLRAEGGKIDGTDSALESIVKFGAPVALTAAALYFGAAAFAVSFVAKNVAWQVIGAKAVAGIVTYVAMANIFNVLATLGILVKDQAVKGFAKLVEAVNKLRAPAAPGAGGQGAAAGGV